MSLTATAIVLRALGAGCGGGGEAVVPGCVVPKAEPEESLASTSEEEDEDDEDGAVVPELSPQLEEPSGPRGPVLGAREKHSRGPVQHDGPATWSPAATCAPDTDNCCLVSLLHYRMIRHRYTQRHARPSRI